MTTEIPTPQIPQSLHAAMAEWGRHDAYATQITDETARLDKQISDMQRQLTEMGQRYADLGRKLHDAERDAAFARSMAEHGCQLAGIEMPDQPPTVPTRPVPPSLLAAQQSGVESLGPIDPSTGLEIVRHPTTPGLDSVRPAAPSETVTDSPPDTGGDQPAAEPGFQPEPAEADSRRRRGARRG